MITVLSTGLSIQLQGIGQPLELLKAQINSVCGTVIIISKSVLVYAEAYASHF